MEYTYHYESPLGKMIMSAEDNALTGLWFGQEREDERTFTGASGNVRKTAGICADLPLAEPLFCRRNTGFSAETAIERNRIPAAGMGDTAYNPIRRDYDLWRNCGYDRKRKRKRKNVGTGGRRSGWA